MVGAVLAVVAIGMFLCVHVPLPRSLEPRRAELAIAVVGLAIVAIVYALPPS